MTRRRYCWVLAWSAILTLIVGINASAQQTPQPKLVIEERTHDFGEMEAGRPLKHAFKVKNSGDRDLLITSVSPSCGCTASEYDKVIPPGKEGHITLAVERTDGYAGEVAKTAAVTTNDPLAPSLSLALRAYFKPGKDYKGGSNPLIEGKRVGSFSVVPGDRWVTSALRGSSVAGMLYLRNVDTAPVRITDVVHSGTDFTVRLQKLEDGKRYELSVVTNPTLKPGQYVETVRLKTDSKAVPEVPITLDLTVYPLVFVTPNMLNLRTLPLSQNGAPETLPMLSVRKIRDQGLKVTRVTSSLPFLNLEVLTEAEGRLYNVRVMLDRSKVTGPGEFRGKILVETNDTDNPVIEVPVRGSFLE